MLVCGALAQPIDREALVKRHTVRVDKVDPEAALSVGNGDFAFTVDATGLQSMEALYFREGIPLETLSTWAWHEFPNTQGLTLADASELHEFHGRKISYATKQRGPAGEYFRQNPHPVPLGQVSLLLKGKPVTKEQLGAVKQSLDLWTGIIRSEYVLAGESVVVETVAHDTASAVGVTIVSPLVKSGALEVRLRFPYSHNLAKHNKPALVWDQPKSHRSQIVERAEGGAVIERALDATRYYVQLRWDGAATLKEAAAHDFRLKAAGDELAFTFAFSAEKPEAGAALGFAEVSAASARGWKDYWTRGGAVDFTGSTDPRAAELERRIVLSQYLMKVNYAGDVPPAETGLTHISWYGKHNSEMYFWHAAHFYQWGRTELLEKSLAWYRKILPVGKADAAAQGFAGVRWPKMAGIDGRTGPGGINPFIIWNQPNPIYLSELVYRSKPTKETLETYRDVVFESAEFLASFAFYDEATKRYVLGPPIKNVSEKSGANLTQNPTFELAYWYYGLQVAQAWRERLGLAPEPKWADILAKLSKLPVSEEGFYLEIETLKDMYQEPGHIPISMMLAYGYLPKTALLDVETARRTFAEVNRRNGADRWMSWQLGQGALTAARLGQTELAVAILTNPSKQTRFMPSGHVRRPKEPEGCVTYLPVNASLLTAAGLMAGGWDGAPEGAAPGFPKDGKWVVRVEGLNPLP
ncbi:hypothetical protein CMV30_08560 [Nibricoccus aquaticus]|uniref:Glycoside hydrolase family 65 n=1 Tax=Nibricoccus aquaticus TaxID=2576891 RepID=A0A290Q6D9_9BACT|nr:hypothetical protein CMV30_08560 [Nibricoccus aquaticus]